jgi:hypothetical protein
VSVPPWADETQTEPVAVWVRSSGVATARVSGVSEARVRGAGHPASVAGAAVGVPPGSPKNGGVVGAGAGDGDVGADDADVEDVDDADEQAVSARPSSSDAGPADLS